jgi:regulator of replication initiation timing
MTSDEISQHDEFRQYLDKSGIIERLTQILVDLYEMEPKPENPLQYIRNHLGSLKDVDVEELVTENEELKLRSDELESTIDSLMNQLEDLRKTVSGT